VQQLDQNDRAESAPDLKKLEQQTITGGKASGNEVLPPVVLAISE